MNRLLVGTLLAAACAGAETKKETMPSPQTALARSCPEPVRVALNATGLVRLPSPGSLYPECQSLAQAADALLTLECGAQVSGEGPKKVYTLPDGTRVEMKVIDDTVHGARRMVKATIVDHAGHDHDTPEGQMPCNK